MKRTLALLSILLTFCCLFTPHISLANDDIASAEEVYGSTPSGDMSRIFLGQIFGSIDHSGLTGSGTLMPAVFKAFNTAALGIGAIIVMFSLIVSTLNTAHQGEILGQQWSTMWVPFRIILGIGILVPSGAGYTLLQSFIMWSVLQGVGAANYVWQQAVDAVNPSDASSMSDRGWIMAGAYYYDLTQSLSTDDVIGDIPVTVNFTFSGIEADISAGDDLGDELVQEVVIPGAIEYFTSGGVGMPLNTLSNYSGEKAKETGFEAITNGLASISTSLNLAVASWMNLFTNTQGDPLLSIQKTGEIILGSVEILWIGIAVLAGAIGVASVCAGVSPIFNMLQNFITWLVPLFTSLLIFLFLSAAFLAYYLPLIPFILFSLGAIGWMFGVIEAIAASPLIALGIMNPHGNDPYFGRAEPALLLLLDIVVRPAMMIIGMMAAMVVVRVAVPFINLGFSITGQNVYAGGISFLTSIIAMIVVYSAIIVTVVQKCFSLIHYVPDRVIRWIGGMPNAFESGAQEEKEIKGGFEKGMQPFGELGGQAATSKASMKMATTGFGAYNEMEKAQRQGLNTTQDGGDSTPGDDSGGDDDDSSQNGNEQKPKGSKGKGSKGSSQTATSSAGEDNDPTEDNGGNTGAAGGGGTTGATGAGAASFGEMMSQAWSNAQANIAQGGSGQFSAVFGPTATSLGNSYGGFASSAASPVSNTISSAISSLSDGNTGSAQASISQAVQQANVGMSQVANQVADSISSGMDNLGQTMADAPATTQAAVATMGAEMNTAVSSAVGSAQSSIISNLTKASNALTTGGAGAEARANDFLLKAQAAANPQSLGSAIQAGISNAVKKADG